MSSRFRGQLQRIKVLKVRRKQAQRRDPIEERREEEAEEEDGSWIEKY